MIREAGPGVSTPHAVPRADMTNQSQHIFID